jgi:ABC-type sugar transport system ATPase subunit
LDGGFDKSPALKILDEIGFKLPAAAMLSDLTIGQQQLVATARASTRGTRFLIFDEPTGYLTRQEAVQLFTLIRRLKAQGVTIVYISHRLEEVSSSRTVSPSCGTVRWCRPSAWPTPTRNG